jgi:hypothetical protein
MREEEGGGWLRPAWKSDGKPEKNLGSLDHVVLRVWALGLGLAKGPFPHTSAKPSISSQFVRAIGSGCRTGINYSGPMPVPILARTGTNGSPRGLTRSEGGWIIGLGSWHELGSLVSAFRAIFCTAAGFVFFFHLFIWCFQFNLIVLHIYSNNKGTTIYITHHGHEYIIYRLIRRALSKHITNSTDTNLI